MSSADFDLDINNYTLEDILNLFKITGNLTEDDVKSAKKIVIQTHPDKSRLPKEYFIFYQQAYKMLLSVWEFKKKGDINKKNENIDYSSLKDDDKNNLLDNFFKNNDKLKESDNFNKWFNKHFEENKIYNEERDNGYGDWLQSTEDIDNSAPLTKSQMNEIFYKKKSEARSLIVKTDIEEYNLNTINSSNLSSDAPSNYDSDLHSSLAYQDLHKAHHESVIPVTDEDYHNTMKFRNMNELMDYRNNQNTRPIAEQQALDYLANKDKNEDEKANKRAYKLAKELEENQSKNNEFWKSIQLLGNK